MAETLDRHGPTGAGNEACKRYDPRGRRLNRLTFTACDVDTAMLSSRVGIWSEGVGPKNVSRDGPCPAPPGRDGNKGDENCENQRRARHGNRAEYTAFVVLNWRTAIRARMADGF